MTKRQYRRLNLCRNKRSDMKTLFAKYIEQKYQDNLLTLSAHHYLITPLTWRIYRSDLRSALRAASRIQLANSRYLFAKSTCCHIRTMWTETTNGSHSSSIISYFDLLARVWWTTNEDAHGTSAEIFRLITIKSRTIST